jgi:hypothetical protein
MVAEATTPRSSSETISDPSDDGIVRDRLSLDLPDVRRVFSSATAGTPLQHAGWKPAGRRWN